MTVTGQLELGNVSYNAAVHCEGDDLAIRQVTLAAPAVNAITMTWSRSSSARGNRRPAARSARC